jgi:hypothetical protein
VDDHPARTPGISCTTRAGCDLPTLARLQAKEAYSPYTVRYSKENNQATNPRTSGSTGAAYLAARGVRRPDDTGRWRTSAGTGSIRRCEGKGAAGNMDRC